MLHTLLKLFGSIESHTGCYSFADPIFRTKECPTTSSYAQTSCPHKSKNHKRHNEDLSGETLTPRNPSKPQSSKTLFAPAGQSGEPPSSSDCDKFQEPTLQKTLMKLSVQPERETDENVADDEFCLSSQ